MMKRVRTMVSLSIVAVLLLAVPMQMLAAGPGDEVSATITVTAPNNYYLFLVEYELSDGLTFKEVKVDKGSVLGNARKAIGWDPNMETSGGYNNVQVTVYATVKDGVKTDQTVNFKKVQYVNTKEAPKLDPQSKTIKIGEEVSMDFDGDGNVTMLDVLTVLFAYLDDVSVADFPEADVDGDNAITMLDVLTVLFAFLDS